MTTYGPEIRHIDNVFYGDGRRIRIPVINLDRPEEGVQVLSLPVKAHRDILALHAVAEERERLLYSQAHAAREFKKSKLNFRRPR